MEPGGYERNLIRPSSGPPPAGASIFYNSTLDNFKFPPGVYRFMDENGCTCGGKGECLKTMQGWTSRGNGPSGYSYETCAGCKHYRESAFPGAGLSSPVPKEAVQKALDHLGRRPETIGISLLDYPSPLCSLVLYSDDEEEEGKDSDSEKTSPEKGSPDPDVGRSPSSPKTGESSESKSLRESGNEHYIKAHPDLIPEQAHIHLTKAIVLYKHALIAAGDKSEAASANKNLGMASYKLCMLMKHQGEPIENLHPMIQKTLHYYSTALKLGTRRDWCRGVKNALRKFSYFSLETIKEMASEIRCAYYLYDFTVELTLPTPLATIFVVIGVELVEAANVSLEKGNIERVGHINALCRWAIKGAFRYGKGKKAILEQARFLKERHEELNSDIASIATQCGELGRASDRLYDEDERCGKDDEKFLRYLYKEHPPIKAGQVLTNTPSPWDSDTCKTALELALHHYDDQEVGLEEDTVFFKVIAKNVHCMLERRLHENYELI